MTELQLQPITGPGEYTRRNGGKAEIAGKDKDGNWIGWAVYSGNARILNAWKSSGEDTDGDADYDIVQPKPEIEIPRELIARMQTATEEMYPRNTREWEEVARVAISWDRATRSKREPTEEEIKECVRVYMDCLGWQVSEALPKVIRRAFELAQEPK